MIFDLSKRADMPAERPAGSNREVRNLLNSAVPFGPPAWRAEKLAKIVTNSGARAAWVEVESDLEPHLVRALRRRGITPLEAEYKLNIHSEWSDYYGEEILFEERVFLSWKEM